ncbi:hypothetical protein BC941DRAFT_505857 [Chlamydoabsidia padenii]|nr:hypothetical protein BC941DRAFT_505857 [Chlamydoabsidia padenii]
MPFRSVTHQLKTKWQQKRTSRAKSVVDLPTPPSTDNETIQSPTSKQQQQQQQTGTTTGAAGTTTTKQDDKKKKVKELPPSPDYLLAGIGDYLFERPLGHGKFSKVMLAKHYLTGEQYAIKVIDKRVHEYRVMSRLVREIRLMEALDHPNVVHLYETVETADSLYLVMEYVPGFNLDEHLQKRHGSLHEDEARLIFRQMVTAVDYCHSRWVVHRDLKAPNVLLKTNGQVKLADFGLGNRFGLQRLRTMCGTVPKRIKSRYTVVCAPFSSLYFIYIGSMLYYSPEIICEQKYIGPEVDCWCLGVTLFRMTSGFEPFSHARTFGELRKDVIDGNYPMPTHFSEGLQQTIQKCLSVDRRRRIALRVALKDDPWLNDGGRLQDLFLDKTTGYYGGFDMNEPLMIQGVPAELDESVRHRMERERSKRQCLRDMEEEKQSEQQVKRTVIYHPINTAIYFTGNATYSPKVEENAQIQELLRAELLAEMKSVLAQVQLTPISQPPSGHSAIQQFFHKLKRPESILTLSSAAYSTNNTSTAYLSSAPGGSSSNGDSGNGDKGSGGGGFSSRLKKTTSTLSLASLYTRPKEHINYYTIQTNLRGSSSATILSSFSSSSSISGSHSLSSPAFLSTTTTTATTSATTGSAPVSSRTARCSFQPLSDDFSQQQGECELILLVQSACQLLGVTYQHEGRTKLTCVLTLRNYAIDNQQQQQQQQQQQRRQSSLQQSSQRRSSRWLQGWRDNDTDDDEGGKKQKVNKKKSKNGLKNSSSSPNLLRDAAGTSSSNHIQQQQYHNGSSTYTSRSSLMDRISNNSSTSRWSRQMRRLSAPFQQWPWSSQSMHLHSSMPIGGPSLTYPTNRHGSGATTATFGQLKTINQQQPQQQNLDINDDDDDDDEKGQNRDGIAMFTMEAYSIPSTNNKQQATSSSSGGGDGTDSCGSTPQVVALRFVKIKGSSKVYKLATGWISGVLASSSVSGGTPTSSTMNVV